MPETKKTSSAAHQTDSDDYGGRIKDGKLVRRRRQQIMDAALGLFLEKGYGSTTIRDICARSAVNQASIYDYVKGKEDILRRILDRMHNPSADNAMRAEFNTASATDLESYISNFLQFAWRENSQAILLAYREAGRLPVEDRRRLLQRDADLVDKVAFDIGRLTGREDDHGRYSLLAEVVVFLTAFMPFRQWHLRDREIDLLVENVTRMVVAAALDLDG